MAEDEGGNGNRATTAMVLRAVDDLGRITAAHFDTVHARLDQLSKIPERVDDLEADVGYVKRDVDLLKTASVNQAAVLRERRAYRMGTLPMIAISFIGLLLTGVNAYAILVS